MIQLQYGNTRTYLIGSLLFDTDLPGTLPRFFRAMKEKGIPFGSIRYVLASHYHPDHMGLVSELMGRGITLVIAEHQLGQVHFSDGIFRRQFGNRYCPVDETAATVITPKGSRAFLKSIGISGEILPTTSHSPDGIALLLDSGECFAGDLDPPGWLGGYESNPALEQDWRLILCRHPNIVYFGHTNPVALGKKAAGS